MNNWTLGSFLFWFALAIVVPGIIIHFTLGRKGGHHLFDKDNLTSDQVKNLPFEMVRKRTIWNLKGSAATILGLAVALLLYPIACIVGLPINVFGISDQTLILYAAGAIRLALPPIGSGTGIEMCKGPSGSSSGGPGCDQSVGAHATSAAIDIIAMSA